MAVPASLILGVFLCILISAMRYWYLKRTRIEYPHKLDDEILEQLRRPSPDAYAKLKKMKEDGKYPFQHDSEHIDAFFDDPEDKTEESEDEEDPPRNLFEEIDYRREYGKKKNKKKRFDRSMVCPIFKFDNPLQRLFMDRDPAKTKPTQNASAFGAK